MRRGLWRKNFEDLETLATNYVALYTSGAGGENNLYASQLIPPFF